MTKVDLTPEWLTLLNGDVVLGPVDVGAALVEMARLDRLADRGKLGFATIRVCRERDLPKKDGDGGG